MLSGASDTTRHLQELHFQFHNFYYMPEVLVIELSSPLTNYGYLLYIKNCSLRIFRGLVASQQACGARIRTMAIVHPSIDVQNLIGNIFFVLKATV